MQILLIIFLVLLVVSSLLFLREYFVNFRLARIGRARYLAIKDLIQKLATGEAVSKDDVLAIAANASLRLPLFTVLNAYNRLAIFPQQYNTLAMGAESHMVNWLEYPTELGHPPDEIHLVETVAIEENGGIYYYYVFRFSANDPGWARKLKWMLGVCGPYFDESAAFDVPARVFSRFKPIEFHKPPEEARWVHDHINV